MSKRLFIVLCILYGLVHFPGLLLAKESVSCYEWNEDKSRIQLDCVSEIITVRSIRHGLSSIQPDVFCVSPNVDLQNDCFGTYNETEVAVFRACNKERKCEVEIPFLSLQEKCNMGEDAAKYVLVEYDCVSEEPETIEMKNYDSNDATGLADQNTLYLTTENFPSFVKETKICEITIQESTKLEVNVMELHQKKYHNLVCAFELIIMDKQSIQRQCTEVFWNASSMPINLEYVAQNSNLQLQIALHKNSLSNGAEGKTWIQLKTYEVSNQNHGKSGFEQIKCGSDVSLWTTPAIPSTETTTSKSTPGITSTVTSGPETETLTPEASNTTPANSSTSTEIYSTTTDGDYAPSKLKDNDIMPIIAGAVAGGLVFIVVMIIIIVLAVRSHQRKRKKPAEKLDVIDAWDNQSVIDAAKKSAQEYKLEEPYDMSRGLSPTYPSGGQNSFKHRLSYSAENEYAEVPGPLPDSRAGSELGVSNKGYENDSYYTGDIEGDMYAQVHKNDRSLRKKNATSVSKDSPHQRLSVLYSKPNKKTKSPSGFDDPSWTNHGSQPDYDNDNGHVQNGDIGAGDDIYGYSTTLH